MKIVANGTKVRGASDKDALVQPFVDDTGASLPRIFLDDLEQMVAVAGEARPPFLTYREFKSPAGLVYTATFKILFNIPQGPSSSLLWVRPWVPVQTCIEDRYHRPEDTRLGGGWLRTVLYTTTAPNNAGELYLSETLSGLRKQIPKCDVRNSEIPLPLYL